MGWNYLSIPKIQFAHLLQRTEEDEKNQHNVIGPSAIS